MKTKIIVNPISGTQNHRNIDKIFEKYLKDYEIVYTEYQNHTIKELKDILTDMNLPTSGNKTKLIQRIVSNKNKISN